MKIKKAVKTAENFFKKIKLFFCLYLTQAWSDMKKLCELAGVSKDKVFPHNLRHLFARTYYSLQKDIVRLADILGHSSVDTTRIYTMETGEEHRKQIEKMHLLRC